MSMLVDCGRVAESTSQLTCRELEASFSAGISVPWEPLMRVRTGMVSKEVARQVRDQLESQLPGRIRQLRVDASDDSVVIRGICCSFYTKQLAQHLAMEVLTEEQLVNELCVLPAK
jgi:hypothetical protein